LNLPFFLRRLIALGLLGGLQQECEQALVFPHLARHLCLHGSVRKTPSAAMPLCLDAIYEMCTHT
jgi:hypothetical protein